MTHSRRFLPEFFEDALEAREWYVRQRSSLGQRFSHSLDETVERIVAAPELFSLVDRTTRVAVVHPFSYGIYFRIVEDVVVFVGVLHLHRRPGLWKRR
jgi:hypothetical protein